MSAGHRALSGNTENHQGIIPMDDRYIGILDEEKIDFYQLDMANDRWVTLTGLHFGLPR